MKSRWATSVITYDLERLALGGNATASLSLASMYERGLAVVQDQPTALAWLAWGKVARTDCDEATRAELLAMYKGLATTAENSVRRGAAHLLKIMRSAGRAKASSVGHLT
jgi:TPR repeat protein